MARNKRLTERLVQNTKRNGAAFSRDLFIQYFGNLKKCFEGLSLSNIINFDETNFADDPGQTKAIVKRGINHVERIMDSSKTSVSVMIAAT